MTDPVEALVSPLRHSPLLPEIADVLQRQVSEERRRRITFYEEMKPSQKVEFIDGEVVVLSPSRNSHLNVTLNISQLLTAYVRKHRLGEVTPLFPALRSDPMALSAAFSGKQISSSQWPFQQPSAESKFLAANEADKKAAAAK